METIKIIGQNRVYIAFCHKFNRDLNSITKQECKDKFLYSCATCDKMEPLHEIQ